MQMIVEQRAKIEISGPDRLAFIQALVTQDVYKLSSDSPALYSLLLTPEGRYLYDFFIWAEGESLILETGPERGDELVVHLKRYQLRRNITIRCGPLDVGILFSLPAPSIRAQLSEIGDRDNIFHDRLGLSSPFMDPLQFNPLFQYRDPRVPALNIQRMVLPPLPHSIDQGKEGAYEYMRILAGLPKGDVDLIPEKTMPLEANLDRLNAISFDKGCYRGQELIARTHYRGQIHKRLLPVMWLTPVPAPHTRLLNGPAAVGTAYSNGEGVGWVQLRLEHLRQPVQIKGFGYSFLPIETEQGIFIPLWPDTFGAPPFNDKGDKE